MFLKLSLRLKLQERIEQLLFVFEEQKDNLENIMPELMDEDSQGKMSIEQLIQENLVKTYGKHCSIKTIKKPWTTPRSPRSPLARSTEDAGNRVVRKRLSNVVGTAAHIVIHEEAPPSPGIESNSNLVLRQETQNQVSDRMTKYMNMKKEIQIEDFVFDVIFTLDPIFHGIHITQNTL